MTEERPESCPCCFAVEFTETGNLGEANLVFLVNKALDEYARWMPFDQIAERWAREAAIDIVLNPNLGNQEQRRPLKRDQVDITGEF